MESVILDFNCSKHNKPFLVWYQPNSFGKLVIHRISKVDQRPIVHSHTNGADDPAAKVMSDHFEHAKFVCPWCKTTEKNGNAFVKVHCCEQLQCAWSNSMSGARVFHDCCSCGSQKEIKGTIKSYDAQSHRDADHQILLKEARISKAKPTISNNAPKRLR